MYHISKYIKIWLTEQPNVNEVSLTDWLLYEVTSCYPFIYYQAFTAHEEAKGGADWEWWILTDNYNLKSYDAYRFVVQAKKLKAMHDNFSILNYSNKNGLQIDLLLQNSKYKNAFPLYMYYSTTEPDIEEQVKNIKLIEEIYLRKCEKNSDGCFLSSAYNVYDILYKTGRRYISDKNLLNYSVKLSVFDHIFSSKANLSKELIKFNNRIIKSMEDKTYENGVHGICHYGKGVPDYLKYFVECRTKRRDGNVFEMQMRNGIDGLGGIGVIDLRIEEK